MGKPAFRAPPKSRHARAFLISVWPKMLGAIREKMVLATFGCAAKSLNSCSSSILHHKKKALSTASLEK